MARAAEQPIDPQVASILTNAKVMRKLGEGVPGFDRAGLLAGIFAALSHKQGIDGQNALAQVMVDELFAAKPGAMSRTRILDSICRLLNWHSDDVHAQPVEEMSEDELKNAISASLPGLKIAAISRPQKKTRRNPRATTRTGPGPRHDDRYRIACGEEVRQRRQAKGMKAADLAMAASCNKPEIYHLENGKRFLTSSKMANIAEALGVPLGDWQHGQFSSAPMPAPHQDSEVIPDPEEDLEAGMDEPCEPDL